MSARSKTVAPSGAPSTADLCLALDDMMLMVCEAAQTGYFDGERFDAARQTLAKARGEE